MIVNRRDKETIMNLILSVAKDDHRIRAVIMNGSRTISKSREDIFQDYDIIYVVNDVKLFVEDKQWIKQFGDILIMQKPDEISGEWPKYKDKFAYLMLFKDGNRIDLTLLHKDKATSMHRDSRSILLLDKDEIIGELELPSDKDYLPTPPSEKEFFDCCNEFFWVATYVAKGIARKELLYAKYMSEQIIRLELIKLLTWHSGIKTNFSVNFGICSKYLEKYLEPELWHKFCKTYTNANYEKMWKSLLGMCDIFNDIALLISKHYKFEFNKEEYNEVIEYLKTVKKREFFSF